MIGNPADCVHSIMTQQTKGEKTGPGNKDKVHSEAEQVGGFLRSLGYQRKLDQSSYGSVLDVLKTIFDASGQQHLVHLVKLRKCWYREIGGFLARHAMPSRISVEENFNLDRQYITELRQENQKKDLLEALEEMIGRNYRDWKGFRSALRRRLGRGMTQMELKILQGHMRFVPLHVVLHLTVYDGSIAQAIQFEEVAYLDRFQSMLPELKLGAIRCRVGDLGSSGKDEALMEDLRLVWDKLLPKNVFSLCRPERVHRVNDGHAVLIVGCESASVMKRLRLNPGGPSMLKRIRESIPELDDAVQKLALICTPKHQGDASVSEGEDTLPPALGKRKLDEPKSFSENDANPSHQERVHEIIQRLRAKNTGQKT